MNRLQERCVKAYSEHYTRMNPSIDPREQSARSLKCMDRTYGEYTNSLAPNSKVLDLGCGTGFLLHWLSSRPNVVPVGVDASPGQIDVAQSALPEIETHCDDGLAFLKSHPASFAGVFCSDVLEHVPSEDLLLEWMEAVRASLLPGGFFCIRVPNAANLFGCYSRYMDMTHARVFTSSSIVQLLEAGDFSRSRVFPIRAGWVVGRLRHLLESIAHRMLFWLTGRVGESTFTRNVCAVGYRE